MESLSDEKLVQMVLDGDREVFSVLISRYERQIYGLAYRLTNNKHEAQDLGQEAFIKIYQSLGKYDPGRPFFSWMYKVAANQCYSILRKKREAETPLESVIEFVSDDHEEENSPEQFILKKENQDTVRRALVSLPEKYRMALILRFMEDMSYQEIADTMEISLSAVESRIHRGKKLLLKSYQEERGELDGQGKIE
ncbi:sigma-70 family RNA polymerase sigma factor [Clostridia bacterium]|nr:sigma-70 family RNA polymerase sigma factor [Clostridia bacterium]